MQGHLMVVGGTEGTGPVQATGFITVYNAVHMHTDDVQAIEAGSNVVHYGTQGTPPGSAPW